MDCHDTRKLLHGYLDGELDLVRSLDIEQHLHDCPDCRTLYQSQVALRAAIKQSAPYHPAPAALRQRVLTSTRQYGRAPRALVGSWFGGFAAGVTVLAMVLLVVVGLPRLAALGPAGAPVGDVLAQEVVASHVRSQITNHSVDVVSSDQHTVKPWFNGKLDFSPVVVDLASQGYPLAGGRLDYLADRPVAALVYRRQQHVINVFIWPAATAPDTDTVSETRQGYNIAHWTRSGQVFWAVTDLNPAEFAEFVKLVQGQTP